MGRAMHNVERRNYTVKETAEYLKVCRATIYNLVKAGKLTPVRIGTRVIFTETELSRFLNEATAA